MGFSSGVKLGDLDDFIAPSQDCVKPLIEAAEGGQGSAKLSGTGDARSAALEARAAELEVPQVQRPNLIKSKQSSDDPKAQIGQVTLSDCLACSGCVTSAETVLLQQQSGEEFLKRVAEAPLTVVTISSEARASLTELCAASPLLTMQRVAEVLRRLGASYVLESSAAEAMALLEGKAEFMKRFQRSIDAPAKNGKADANGEQKLPLLTSHCPGWTLYAEKVVDPAVLPHLLPFRPPQQIQGRLVKTFLLEAHNRRRLHRWWRVRSPLFAAQSGWWLKGLVEQGACSHSCGKDGCKGGGKSSGGYEPYTPQDVYHVSVQPCYDRKIEAARPAFQVPGSVCEVDTVLTTTELLDLVQHAVRGEGAATPDGGSAAAAAALLATVPPCPLSSEVITDVLLGDLRVSRPKPLLCLVGGNVGSGGFAEHIFREAARDLFGREVASPLEFKTRQNEDMREVTLRDPASDRVLLRFVAAYGFRNIQNVIRRVTKPGAAAGQECGHFVEMMACPGGCLNGGGQVPAPKTKAGNAATRNAKRLATIEATLLEGDGTAILPPSEHPLLPALYASIEERAANSNGAARQRGGAAAAAQKKSQEAAVGGAAVRSWLSAEWRSLKVDAEGKPIVGTSALKW